ncbi:MAG: SEL1-like repeat protein [Candidatus Paraprevotella stercoravium]|uniref:SEL1-like repeat protein n=1 Tax=Candidatus Paraprevotella stercoravium TaxID=2838725 RepID=A0A9E2P594_9BACT|nr:SEL1-like repeat protein [Candidatus Paraprevotella stercoravium]
MNHITDHTLKLNTSLQGKSYTYTIQKVLGQGTFGITYLATTQIKVAGALGELETTMQVAVKEFFMREINGREDNTVTSGSKGGLYDKYKQKFAHEAKNLSKLHHPNIVKVLEYFEANNTVYYAMEYVEGGSLDEYIAQKKGLSEEECVKYTRQIGTALSYMHAHKMLHLDLKPGNVMLRKNGDAVLIDFGLSKQYDENGNPESSTTVGGGTPGYAPLEQADYQEGKSIPVAIDVYALGATLFKMLTGVCPPKASILFNDGFPAYTLQQHGVSEGLIACVAHAMAPSKKDRLPNVEVFMQQLGSSTEEETEMQKPQADASLHSVPPATPTTPTPAPRPRKNFTYPLLALMAVLLVGIIYLISRSDVGKDDSLITQLANIDTVSVQRQEPIVDDTVPIRKPELTREEPSKEEVTPMAQPQPSKPQPAKEEKVTPPATQRTENGPKDAQAQYELGNKYYEEKNYSEAIKWFRKAAEQGNTAAQTGLGDMYHYGHGVTRNYKEAVKWYRKAAEQGYAEAQSMLGEMYGSGWGVTCDQQKSFQWYWKAAEQGYVHAQFCVGNKYFHGWGVTKDYQEAIKWYRKAAEQGSPAAQNELASMYYEGKGVTKNKQEAAK